MDNRNLEFGPGLVAFVELLLFLLGEVEVAGIDVVDGVPEGVDRRERVPFLVEDLLDRLPLVQQLLAGVVFVPDLEDLELVGVLHPHAVAYQLFEVPDLRVVD